MSRPPKHREAIVEAAASLFRRQGYAATGLAQIVALSGAPKGSLYHYFPAGKAQIAEAAIGHSAERVRRTLGELAATGLAPGALLRRYGAMVGDWMAASGFREGNPITTVLLETVPGDEAIRAAGLAAAEAWAEVLAASLRSCRVDAQRARRLARAALAALDGALVQARLAGDPAPIIDAVQELALAFDAAVATAQAG